MTLRSRLALFASLPLLVLLALLVPTAVSAQARITVLAPDGSPVAQEEEVAPAPADPIGELHLTLRAAAEYANFGPGLGGSVLLEGERTSWTTDDGAGALSLGLLLTYQVGADLLYPWVTPSPSFERSGADHRIGVALSVGHRFYIGRERLSMLALRVFLGATLSRSSWCMSWLEQGVSGCQEQSQVGLSWGPEIEYAYRFSESVGVSLVAGGAMPPRVGAPGGSMLRVGAGLTFYLL